ncbi:NAD(P)-dependent alcohol dehydrogenase [bacterium]|nr:NAD(P)-dependent alcohol dehydrogenase [bacterium]
MAIPKTCKAAYLESAGQSASGTITFRTIKTPKPKPDEALVKVEACGVCGSDVHYYQHGRIGDFVVRKPLILGHECAGTVVAVGRRARSVALGDRVAVEAGHTCGQCEHCRTGRYNLCPDVVFLATPPVHGAFVQYLAHPASWLHKLPDGVSFDEGAMLEPFNVGLYAARLAGVQPGSTVAVLGSGPIGLTALQAAKASGATTLIATDVVPSRLRLAKKLGATATINAAEEDTVGAILALTDGKGADVVFEAAGTVPTTQQSVAAVTRGGAIALIGLGPQSHFEMPVMDIICKEVRLTGQFRYANLYPAAIEMVASGAVDLRSMINRRYPFADLADAMAACAKVDPKAIKTMIGDF